MEGEIKTARIEQKSTFFISLIFFLNSGYKETKNTNFWKGIAWKFFWSSVDNFSNKLKTAFKKIGALIRSMKFLSPEVSRYCYKSTIQPWLEYCYHVWASEPSFYLEMLDKLQKQIWTFSWTLGLLSKCSQLKSLLLVLL